MKKAGIAPSRETGTHQLRHRFASVLLAGGVDVKTLAEYMGHSDASVTLGTYSHLLPNAADKARRAIEAAFAAEHDAEGFSTIDRILAADGPGCDQKRESQ